MSTSQADVPRTLDTTSFSHTLAQDNAWWQLQLDNTEYIESVVVTVRRDACEKIEIDYTPHETSYTD